MSREVGTLVFFPGEAGKPSYFKGRLELAGASGDCFLVPNRGKAGHESRPDFHLKLMVNGHAVEYGAAWRKVAAGSGDDYLSITVDAPGMPAEIYCAAFMLDLDEQPDKDSPDHWRIVWGRPKARGAQPAPADLGGDYVPY